MEDNYACDLIIGTLCSLRKEHERISRAGNDVTSPNLDAKTGNGSMEFVRVAFHVLELHDTLKLDLP